MALYQRLNGVAAAIALFVGACTADGPKAPLCTPGELHCTDSGPEVCNSDGTALAPASCPAGEACSPVLVAQYFAGQYAPDPGSQEGDANIGDPSLVLVPPLRQLRDNYVFLTPANYALDYLSIAAPAAAAVYLDGADADEIPLARFATIGAAAAWRALRVPLSDGFHELICSEPCSVMVHGYDIRVSYGYPAGLDLGDQEGN